ncbi:hypothetical protein ES703_34125 [subsurface metagenome]
MGLKGTLVDMVPDKFFLSHVIRLGKPLVDIAKMMVDHGVDVILESLMKLRRPVLHRLHRVEHCRKLLVIDLDQFQGSLCRLLVHSDNSCHFIANMPHLLFGQNVFIITGRGNPVSNIGNIFSGQNQFDAWQFFRLARVDLLDPSMSNRRMEDLSVEHVLKIEIGRVFGPTGDFLGRIHSGQTSPHRRKLCEVIGMRGRFFSFFVFFPTFDSFQDPAVSRAAAEVSGERLFDLFIRRIRIAVDQGDSAHDHSGRAEAALNGSMIDKSPLQGMELAIPGYALDSGDLRSLTGCSQDQAAVFRLPVNEDCARTAHSKVAPFFCSYQPQFVSENIKQSLPVFDRHRMLFTVDLESHDAVISRLLSHGVYFFSFDFSRARSNAPDKLRRVNVLTSSFLYQAEPRISEMGFPSLLAIADASSKIFGEGAFVWRNSEVF